MKNKLYKISLFIFGLVFFCGCETTGSLVVYRYEPDWPHIYPYPYFHHPYFYHPHSHLYRHR